MVNTVRSARPALRRRYQPAALLGSTAMTLLLATGIGTAAPSEYSTRKMTAPTTGTLDAWQGAGSLISDTAGYREGRITLYTGKVACAPVEGHLARPMARASGSQEDRVFSGHASAAGRFAANADWWTPYRHALSLPVWRDRNVDLLRGSWEIEVSGFSGAAMQGAGPQQHPRGHPCPSAWRAPVYTL